MILLVSAQSLLRCHTLGPSSIPTLKVKDAGYRKWNAWVWLARCEARVLVRAMVFWSSGAALEVLCKVSLAFGYEPISCPWIGLTERDHRIRLLFSCGRECVWEMEHMFMLPALHTEVARGPFDVRAATLVEPCMRSTVFNDISDTCCQIICHPSTSKRLVLSSFGEFRETCCWYFLCPLFTR